MVTLKSKYVQTVDMSVLEEDLVFKTGTKQALYIKNIAVADINYTAVGNDLVLSFKNSDYTITLNNYIKKNGKHSYKYIQTDSEDGVYNMNIIKEGLVDNPNTIGIPKKGTTVKGTQFNDIIDVLGYSVAKSGKKKDKGLTIKTYSGNDDITGTTGNDKITGGAGYNTIHISAAQSFGNDTVVLTKGENLKFVLDIADEKGSYLEYGLSGKNLIIKVYGEATKENLMGKITVKNYAKKDVITSAGSLCIYDTNGDLIQDLRKAHFVRAITNTYKKTSFAGTWLNDDIDASGYQLYLNKKRTIENNTVTKKGLKITGAGGNDNIIGSKYSDTIKCGAGDDVINGGTGNDTITGGNGKNTLVFEGSFGNDVVNLTNGENLTLDFTSFGYTDVTDLKFAIVGNDVKIIAPDGSGSVLLKNFAKTNVVGDNGSVILKLVGKTIDMNEDRFLEFEKDDFTRTGIFIGSRLSETIDATGLNLGATISAGLGSNTIVSTDGNYDKITAGNDGNIVILKSGNKVVTTGSGDDDVYITGTGEKSLKLGAGTNTINLDNSSAFGNVSVADEKVYANNKIIFSNDISGNYSLTRDNANFIIQTSDSSIDIKEYFGTNSRGATTTFFVNDTELSFDDLVNEVGKFNVTGKGTLLGTNYNDSIIATDFTSSSASGDTIKAGKGDDTINAGKGKNYIYFYEGDGNDIIKDGGGTDTLVFDKGTNLKATLNNGTLKIEYGNSNDTVTIENYSDNHSVKYIKIGSSTKEVTSYLTKEEASIVKSPTEIPDGWEPTSLNGNIRGTTGNDILIGTNGNDIINGLAGDDIIYGGGGNDQIRGANGDDIIIGGRDSDILSGGGGNNIFYFASGDGSDYIDECGVVNTLAFYGLNSVNNLKLNASYDKNNDVTLIISGYGTSYDKITITSFISSTTYHDYSKYTLEAYGKDKISLYEYVANSSDVAPEIREEIAGFMAIHAKNEGLTSSAVTSTYEVLRATDLSMTSILPPKSEYTGY